MASTDSLVQKCLEHLETLELHVKLGQQELQLKTDGTKYGRSADGTLKFITMAAGSGSVLAVASSYNDDDFQKFRLEAAAQAEALLYMGYKLKAVQLTSRVQEAIRYNCWHPGAILHDMQNNVFSARVIEAAQLSQDQVREAVMQTALCDDFIFTTKPDPRCLLKPINLTDNQMKPLQFDAVLQGPLMGSPAGTQVAVELDLFGRSSVKLNGSTWLLRHKIGYISAVMEKVAADRELGGASTGGAA